MTFKGTVVLTFSACCFIVCIFFALAIHQCKASAPDKPLQLSGCTATSRDIGVYKAQQAQVVKGVRKPDEQESLDQIVQDSDMGLHACILVDPTMNKRFVVVFYGTGYQGHNSLTIAEEK